MFQSPETQCEPWFQVLRFAFADIIAANTKLVGVVLTVRLGSSWKITGTQEKSGPHYNYDLLQLTSVCEDFKYT